jgi:hypothetical protein
LKLEFAHADEQTTQAVAVRRSVQDQNGKKRDKKIRRKKL